MANKIFSYYNSDAQHQASTGWLIVEAGSTHFACITRGADHQQVTAFEWFKHDRLEPASFEALLDSIKSNSQLLNNGYDRVRVFVNNGTSVLIPPRLFTTAAAEDYLNMVTGEAVLSQSLHDTIEEGDGFVNAFRVKSAMSSLLNNCLGAASIEHTFSQTLRQLLRSNLPSESMFVQFYDGEINVVVFRQGKLQLMQNFTYTLADDVLYYLLSLTQRFHLDHNQLVLKISGLVDMNAALYTQLLRFFKNVSPYYADQKVLPAAYSEHPSHYFTPIFNLVL